MRLHGRLQQRARSTKVLGLREMGVQHFVRDPHVLRHETQLVCVCVRVCVCVCACVCVCVSEHVCGLMVALLLCSLLTFPSPLPTHPCLPTQVINASSGRSLQTERRIPDCVVSGKFDYGFKVCFYYIFSLYFSLYFSVYIQSMFSVKFFAMFSQCSV